MSWNYRVCREMVNQPGEDEKAPFYTLREVYYDAEGKPNAWGKEPATFAGDTPGEVIESLLMATKAWPHGGVLDLDTREAVALTYHGKAVKSR